MEIVFWTVVFIASLYLMLRGADFFLKNAELVGIHFGLSPFVIGVLIVGIGTSLPELVSALVAVFQGIPEVVAANAIGSNIANILLIGGSLAFLGKRLTIDKDLLDAELPFFVISTVLFLMVAFDAEVTVIEAFLLALTYGVYLLYLFTSEEQGDALVEAKEKEVRHERWFERLPSLRVIAWTLIGLAGLLVGAKFLIDAVIALAGVLNINPSLISITGIALGTSLPELVVSIEALRKNKATVAIGNIFGSNTFNILLAVGIPGLLGTVPIVGATFGVGVPVLLAVSFIFLIIGLARKLYRWEGVLFLILYLFFLLKIAEYLLN